MWIANLEITAFQEHFIIAVEEDSIEREHSKTSQLGENGLSLFIEMTVLPPAKSSKQAALDCSLR